MAIGPEWESFLIALLGGGGLGAIITAFVNSKKTRAEASVLATKGKIDLAEAWQGYAKEQYDRANRFEREVHSLREELIGINAELQALKLAFTKLQDQYDSLQAQYDELAKENDRLKRTA